VRTSQRVTHVNKIAITWTIVFASFIREAQNTSAQASGSSEFVGIDSDSLAGCPRKITGIAGLRRVKVAACKRFRNNRGMKSNVTDK
jgi:hypothetical protein